MKHTPFRLSGYDRGGRLAALSLFLGLVCAVSVSSQTASEKEDSFESDDTSAEATWIGVNGPTQEHNLHTANDEDWARLYAETGQEVTVETMDLGADCDTFIVVLGADETTVVASNDDAGAGEDRSYVRFVAQETGLYYVRVHFSSESDFPTTQNFDTGYTLRVWEEQGGISGSILCTVWDANSPTRDPVLTATALLQPFGLRVSEGIDGVYAFIALPSGAYTVTLTAPGYASVSRTANLSVGQTANLSFPLQAPTEGGEGCFFGCTCLKSDLVWPSVERFLGDLLLAALTVIVLLGWNALIRRGRGG